MYRTIPHKYLFLAAGWLVLGTYLAIGSLNQLAAGTVFRPMQAVTIAWVILSFFLHKPVWRWFWKKWPSLGRWIYPDLNGLWEVEIASNISIHRQIADTVAGRSAPFDIVTCDDAKLAPLESVRLQAEIDQSWFKIEISFFDSTNRLPIKGSEIVTVDPKRAEGLKAAMLNYIFRQTNAKVAQGDERVFEGAAMLDYDIASDELRGFFWTNRMWHRAQNTAGTIVYRRV